MRAVTWVRIVLAISALATASAVACDRMRPASPTAPAPNGQQDTSPDSARSGLSSTISAADVTFTGAGDIAVCGSDGSERTARLLDLQAGFVFSLGDNVYPSSTTELLTRCYEPSWGRHRTRTYAVPGNHDWEVQNGAPYFAFFGAAAGPPGLGYFSFDIGAWHVLALNSNIAAHPGSAQYEWARQDAAAARGTCALALWHHPVFSSGGYGNNPHMKEMWRLLDAANVDVVVTGHEHSYERFAPQNADGQPTSLGMRQFVVGTGGAQLRPFAAIQPNSEARRADVWGVLRLVLRSTAYDWEFIASDAQSFGDAGSERCAP